MTPLDEIRARFNKLHDMMQGNTAYKLMDLAGWLLDDLPQINLLLDELTVSHEYPDEQLILDAEVTAAIEKGEEAAA